MMTDFQSIPSKKIAIIGECMIELSGKPFEHQSQSFGGDTLNTAVYLSRLAPSLQPYYVTGLGRDDYSLLMEKAWQNEGIDTSLTLTMNDKLPGLYSIHIDHLGERSFHYWRNDSAARYLCEHPQFFQVVDALTQVDLVYLSGISLAILPEEGKVTLLKALSSLKAQGVKIAMDSNYRPHLWSSRIEAKNWLDQLYALTDIALVTGEDEDLLLGLTSTKAEATADRLHKIGVRQVVVKLGAEGAMWSQNDTRGFVAGNKVEKVVDTTAAGDAFNGAFLAAWKDEQSMEKCCHRGNQLASQVIQFKGAIIPKEQTSKTTNQMRDSNEQ